MNYEKNAIQNNIFFVYRYEKEIGEKAVSCTR